MFFRNFLLLTLGVVALPQNIEVRDAYVMNIRDGYATSEYIPHAEPSYAGYTFDVTKIKSRNNSVSILIGQPREGEVNATTSAGKIMNCEVDFDVATKATTAGLAQSTYVKANCSNDVIFDSTDRRQTGDFHEHTADALGLTLESIGDTGNYAICAQGRQRQCPGENSTASSPGACYFGNPDEDSWNFMRRNEPKCFDQIIDMIFVVDGSESIGKEDFQIVRDWLVEAITVIDNLYGDAVRTEVLQYAAKPARSEGIPLNNDQYFVIPFTLNDALSIKEMEVRIKEMTYLSKTTYTYYGLRRACELEFHRSTQYPNSTRVIVVITDGKADDGGNLPTWWNTYGATKFLIPYAIGVGEDVKMDELRMIANGGKTDERVLTVGGYAELSNLLSTLTSSIAPDAITDGSSGSGKTVDLTAANSTHNRQMGLSITTLEDGSIHFGSVGMYLDSGSIMRYDSSKDTEPDVTSFHAVQRALPIPTADSYLGYTTISGYFNGPSQGQYIAAGAPRYKLKGAVVLFKPVNSSEYMDDSFTILPPNDARDQVAAYFGGCLLSVDVTGDGFDELFVASPLFVGENYDEGRVSVYIGYGEDSIANWTQKNFIPVELFGDRSQGARFGSAMARAGDLNDDGFQDVVIGAPVTDGGKGAVFIYHGMDGAISPKYNQRIQASSLTGATLQYFGQSLQGDIDVDDNGYSDIFVGSPRTDTIVMLKSRPIVRISSSIQYLNPIIPFMSCVTTKNYGNCAALQVCFFANGTSVEDVITITYKLTVDSERGRAVFNSSLAKTMSKTAPIRRQTQQCFNHSLNILENATDFKTSIEAKLEFGLSESHTNIPMSSVTEPTTQNTNAATIEWEKECALEVCVPDLFVSGANSQLPSTIIISPSTANTPVSIPVSLGNTGETSFLTKLKITYPTHVTIRTIEDRCVEEDGTPTVIDKRVIQLYKYVGEKRDGLQSSKSQCSFAFNASLDDLREESSLDRFHVSLYIYSDSSASDEDNSTMQNNNWNASIPIKYKSDYTVRRDIGDTLITFNNTEGDTTYIKSITQIGENTSDVEVDIRITASGYSNIPLAEIAFTYPWLIDDTFPVLYLYKLECPTRADKAVCTCDTSMVDKYGLLDNSSNPSAIQSGSGESAAAAPAPSMDAFIDKDMICPNTDAGSNYSCAVIPCTISDLYSSGEVHFKASFRLWTRSLNGMFNNPNITSLAIRSNLKMSTTEKSPQIIGEDGSALPPKEQEVVVTATKFVTEVTVVTTDDSWLYIALGIAGGVIFLILVALALWKCGFFKNQYGEKLQDLDDETNFTNEERAAASAQFADNSQNQIEITEADRYSAAIASSQTNTAYSKGSENTNQIYINEGGARHAAEASALQALQEVTDVGINDSEPDYDEPPDGDDDSLNKDDNSARPTEQTAITENEFDDDEPDYDLPPDDDFLYPPTV